LLATFTTRKDQEPDRQYGGEKQQSALHASLHDASLPAAL
jgi:hypothetical protein